MPHRFRTADGIVRKPGKPFPLFFADGTLVAGIWAGCAQNEKRDWWLKKPGNQLVQSSEVVEIAVEGEDDGMLRWGAAPPGARLFFILEPPKISKSGGSYQLAKMVTIAATPEQLAFFRDERFSLFGKFDAAGQILPIPPLSPPPPETPEQGELF